MHTARLDDAKKLDRADFHSAVALGWRQMKPIAGTDFFENGLSYYCILAKHDIQEYRSFNTLTELSWKSKDAELQGQIDSILKNHPSSNHDEIIESFGWELHLNQSRYPHIHRSALVVALNMLLEDQLDGLCRTISDSIESKIGLSDMAGQGTDRALLFLSRIAEFDLGKLQSLAFVKNARRLRNRIVHAGGFLSDDESDKLNKFVQSQDGLRGDPGCRVIIDASFVDTLLEKCALLFDELHVQVEEFMGRADT